MTRRLAVAAVITFSALLGSVGGVANAATPTPPPPPPAGPVQYAPNGQIDNPDRRQPAIPEASLDTKAGSGDVSTQDIVPNPYGCKGQTQLPHYSYPDASTHSRTSCSVSMVRVYAENWQYRQRWYGAESFGHGTGLRDFATQSTDAVARGNCYNDGYYTYETEGYHEAFDGGTTYTGWTRNSASFDC